MNIFSHLAQLFELLKLVSYSYSQMVNWQWKDSSPACLEWLSHSASPSQHYTWTDFTQNFFPFPSTLMASVLIFLIQKVIFQSSLRFLWNFGLLSSFLLSAYLLSSLLLLPLAAAVTIYFISSFLLLNILSLEVAPHHSFHRTNSFHRGNSFHRFPSHSGIFLCLVFILIYFQRSPFHLRICQSTHLQLQFCSCSFLSSYLSYSNTFLYSTLISSCISVSHTFFLPEHYEMTLHAYANSVRNSLKDNIHLQLLHPVIIMVSAIFWSSPLVPRLLHFFSSLP